MWETGEFKALFEIELRFPLGVVQMLGDLIVAIKFSKSLALVTGNHYNSWIWRFSLILSMQLDCTGPYCEHNKYYFIVYTEIICEKEVMPMCRHLQNATIAF
jgi:hypothetical protein